MTNFTVLTDEQAAHDAATSKRYIEALRELQAENARLRAHIQEAVEEQMMLSGFAALAGDSRVAACAKDRAERHLAALGETK